MEHVEVKDQPDSGIPLTSLKIGFLNDTIRSFIKVINNFDIKNKAVRDLRSSMRSFYSIYSLAEEVRRTKIEVIKFVDIEINKKQLQYYKDLVEKNISIMKTCLNQNNSN